MKIVWRNYAFQTPYKAFSIRHPIEWIRGCVFERNAITPPVRTLRVRVDKNGTVSVTPMGWWISRKNK